MAVSIKLRKHKNSRYPYEPVSPGPIPTSSEISVRNSFDSDSVSSVTTIDLSGHEQRDRTIFADDSNIAIANNKMLSTKAMSADAASDTGDSDFASRRSSGRVRKPTAKAQALASSLSEVISIPKSPTASKRSTNSPEQTTTDNIVLGAELAPVEIEITQDIINTDAEIQPTIEEPVKRLLRRERKPTVKILEATNSPRKRSRTPTSPTSPLPIEEIAANSPNRKKPRSKIVKLSYKSARLPSDLRIALSTSVVVSQPSHTEPRTSTNHSTTAIMEELEHNQPEQKQTRLILKTKKQPLDITTKDQEKAMSSPVGCLTSTTNASKSVSKPCDLSCLDPTSRLLAFAHLAMESPDSDDDEETPTGLLETWLNQAQGRFCNCHNKPKRPRSRATSADLIEALLPNIVQTSNSAGKPSNDIEMTDPRNDATISKPLTVTTDKPAIKIDSCDRSLPDLSFAPRSASQTITETKPPQPSTMSLLLAATSNRPASRSLAKYASTPVKAYYHFLDELYELADEFRELRADRLGPDVVMKYDMTYDEIKTQIEKCLAARGAVADAALIEQCALAELKLNQLVSGMKDRPPPALSPYFSSQRQALKEQYSSLMSLMQRLGEDRANALINSRFAGSPNTLEDPEMAKSKQSQTGRSSRAKLILNGPTDSQIQKEAGTTHLHSQSRVPGTGVSTASSRRSETRSDDLRKYF